MGAVVGNKDLIENKDCDDNFVGKVSYSEPFSKGYKVAVVALPDKMCFAHCKEMIETGYERLMVEKPGCQNADELSKLVALAAEKNVTFYINYQRSFDPKVAKLLNEIKQKTADGYQLEYCSVYSCDKAQPPQHAQQYLNQGCHDYALCLSILESCNMDPIDLQARGVRWGEINDTRFLKITGTCGNESARGLWDVQMGRVNSTGTFTEMFVKMSKMNADKTMYEPFEAKLKFPEEADPDATWAEVWKDAFVQSVGAVYKGENGVPLSFGLNVLRLAEMIGESINNGSKIVENKTIELTGM